MTPRFVLDEGTDKRETIAKGDGNQILDLPVLIVGDTTFSRWTPTDEEREAIAAGADILVAVLNAGHPLQPLVPLALQPDALVTTKALEAIADQLCG